MRVRTIIAIGLLTISALAMSNPAWVDGALEKIRNIADPLIGRGPANASQFGEFQVAMIEALPPQRKAERALQLAINRYEGASEYVLENADLWRGEIHYTESLASLTDVGLNSPDLAARMATFEVYLAAFDLEKSGAEIDRLISRFENEPGARPWAIWSVGLIGARGQERERAFAEIIYQVETAADPERLWSVNALGVLGGQEVIEPLLLVAAQDSNMAIRERAFCALATAATLHIAERYSAVPALLDIARNHGQPEQVREWSFQALREIAEINLPDYDPSWESQLSEIALLPH